MADIAATDVVYAVLPYPKGSLLEDRPPRYINLVSVSFGNGVLTVPTNGIPLSGFGLGMPEDIVEYVIVVDSTGAGSIYFTYDSTNNSLKSADAGFDAGSAPAATTLIVLARGY
jgi:hypothetical protein